MRFFNISPPLPSLVTHSLHCTHVIFWRERWLRVIGAVTITQGIGDGSGQRQSVHTPRASFALAVERRHAFRVAHARSSPYIRLHVRQIAASVAFPIPVRVRVCFFCRVPVAETKEIEKQIGIAAG